MTDVLGSALFYAGVVIALGGLLSLIRPFHWADIHTRGRAALVAAAGMALASGATEFPNPTRATAARDTLPSWRTRSTASLSVMISAQGLSTLPAWDADRRAGAAGRR
jgi:hypothetical protein